MVYAEYPLEALEKGISGTVTVNIEVNAGSDVTTVGAISGPQELRAKCGPPRSQSRSRVGRTRLVDSPGGIGRGRLPWLESPESDAEVKADVVRR